MDANIIAAAASSFTVLASMWAGFLGYLNRRQAMQNELEIARIHACLHEAREDQLRMHNENAPVMQATLATVQEIRDATARPDGQP